VHRIAIIDVGTNSILYLLAQKEPNGEIVTIHQETKSVRLGRGVVNAGTIQDKPVQNAVDIITHFKNLSRKQDAQRVVITGTHIFRAARNRDDVKKIIEEKTGLTLEILSEGEEARWSYRGAVYGRRLEREIIVCDIGGGSTEIILGNGKEISNALCLPLGAVGLTEKYLRHDPPEKSELRSLEEDALSALQNPKASFLKLGKQFIGVGGTATTLAAMHLQIQRYDPHRIDGCRISRSDIENLYSALCRSSLQDRKILIPFDPERADILIAGTAILKSLLLVGGFTQMTVSDRGLRFGIALREFNET
jgi:exopolyphosphatase/guanosine-5'-triphosphate,3'-diphosphate pyrophosphatase